ncbi:hypothetical protein ACFL1K_01735 [Candidatus Omnitrophota bacterium]
MKNPMITVIASVLFIIWTVLCGGMGYVINQYLKDNYFGGFPYEHILKASPFVALVLGIYAISTLLRRFHQEK